MNNQKSELYFLFFLLAGTFVLTFFVFKPFFYVLALAIVFATIFAPINKYSLTIMRGNRGLSAFFTTSFVFIVVLVPITFLSVQIFKEATSLYSFLAQNGNVSIYSRGVMNEIDKLNRFISVSNGPSIDLGEYLKQWLGWLIQNLGPIFSNVAKVILSVFVFLVALYSIFKDGNKLKATIITLSPLRDEHDETIFNKLASSINSVIKGFLAIALIQGVLTSIGFTIFGIPNEILWGTVATIAALIPGIGTSLVLFPGVLYLYFSGDVSSAIGLLLWGIIAVGLIDNYLGPKLIGDGTKLHPFLILISILGGIALFGPIGFLLGPLVLSSLFTLSEIYFTISKEYHCK